jgi:DnaJ-class molecular chaperone
MIDPCIDLDPRAPYNQLQPVYDTCPDCEGRGFLLLSKCCEVPVMQDHNYCPDCGNELKFFPCPGCDGEGKRAESESDRYWKNYVE